MNVNEVIANRAIEILGGKKDQKNQFILMIMLIKLNLQMILSLLRCTLRMADKTNKKLIHLT